MKKIITGAILAMSLISVANASDIRTLSSSELNYVYTTEACVDSTKYFDLDQYSITNAVNNTIISLNELGGLLDVTMGNGQRYLFTNDYQLCEKFRKALNK